MAESYPGDQTLAYDSSDRHVSTRVGGLQARPDPGGRIVERTETGAPTVRYGFAGPGDGPSFVMDPPPS